MSGLSTSALRDASRRIYRATGIVPTIERMPDGGVMFAVVTDRVVARGGYVRGADGGFSWGAAGLTIDGVPCRPVDEFGDLGPLLADPGPHLHAHRLTGGADEPVGEVDVDRTLGEVDLEQVPSVVRSMYELLTARLPDGASTTVGTSGDGYAMIVTLDSDVVRFEFGRQGGRWAPLSYSCLSDGAVRHGAIRDIAAMIDMIRGVGNSPISPGTIGRAGSTTRSNSVEVRRASVVRT